MERRFGWASLLVAFCTLLVGAQGGCARAPSVSFGGSGEIHSSFRVDVADTFEKRRWGLMYRHDLGTDEGMLFVFPDEKNHLFWMKNTLLSLDIIFMDRRRRVVGIVRNTVPFSTRSVGVGAPSKFVLEIRGGLARLHGVAVNDVARFEGIP